ncbi:MAG: hypothetical protein RIB45_17890 [Marivibrio sp.]|uniref:hypothetical protein n=1 Tax=Marivibrio sp. TaxID=2039719 RepID=UPI0032EE4046
MAEYNLKLIFQAVDKVTGPARRMGQAVNRFARDTGLDRVAASAKKLGANFGNLVKQAGAFALKGGVAAGALFAMVTGSAAAADQLAKTSDKLGIGVEELQEYRHAADLAGISQETFDMALQRFTRRTAEAAAGTGVAKDALAALGIRLKDSEGNMRPTGALLEEVADKMTSIEDPAKRVRLAFTLFDAEGVSMVNMLRNGSDAIQGAREEARKLGLITEEQARAAEAFTDNWTRLKKVVSVTGHAIAGELMPHFSAMLTTVKDLAIEAKPEIMESLRTGIERAAEVLPGLLGGLWSLAKVMGSVIATLAGLIDTTIGWEGAAIALAVILGGKVIVAAVLTGKAFFDLGKDIAHAGKKMAGMAATHLPKLWAGLMKMLPMLGSAIAATWAWTAALLANPLTWMVAGVIAGAAAIGAAAYVIYDNWEKIESFFRDLWEGVKAAFEEGFVQGVVQILKSFNPASLLASAVDGLVQYLFGVDLAKIGAEWMAGFGQGLSAQWDSIVNWLEGAIDALVAWMPSWVKDRLGISGASGSSSASSFTPAAPSALAPGGAGAARNRGEISVRFENAPANMRVERVKSDSPDLDLGVETGLAMGQS